MAELLRYSVTRNEADVSGLIAGPINLAINQVIRRGSVRMCMRLSYTAVGIGRTRVTQLLREGVMLLLLVVV